MNICTLTDSYKTTHHKLYPPGTGKIYSYFESRGGKWPSTVFFGLQYILQEYLTGERVSANDVARAMDLYSLHFGQNLFNYDGWMHIVRDHGGRLPFSIKAVPEGTVVPTHNVLMTVENTCRECFWLPNYIETLLVQAWYPTTVATQSREIKKVILKYLHRTGDPGLINFKLHDFGFRGVSSVESAGIGGAAHLVNFLGSDTVRGIEVLAEHYSEPCAGFSIPASEHSTITSWGRDREVDAMRNMLEKYPTGLVACVSDSFNIYDACTKIWGGVLKDVVMQRDGCLVVRPDSGDPAQIVLSVVANLFDSFGGHTNAKGFKVLDPHVRVIQGDGVNIDSIDQILQRLETFSYSADNVAFGMGGALLQKLNRDDLKFAFKCSYAEGQNENSPWPWMVDVYKDPITDQGKQSKRGRLRLIRDEGDGTLYTTNSGIDSPDQLVEVFRDGEMLVRQTLAEIRQRAGEGL